MSKKHRKALMRQPLSFVVEIVTAGAVTEAAPSNPWVTCWL
jgi:hypothetical protein